MAKPWKKLISAETRHFLCRKNNRIYPRKVSDHLLIHGELVIIITLLVRGNFGAHLLTSDPALLSLLEAVDDVLNCVLHLIAGELEDVHVEPMYVVVVGEQALHIAGVELV